MARTKGKDFVLGIDFGTDSVRAVVADAADGRVVGSGVANYKRWAEGRYCAPRENAFRQHPLDYIEGMEEAVAKALAEAAGSVAPEIGAIVRGLCVDTTGSTPCLADASGRPLALDPEFSEEPDAMFILWKDHRAVEQAERINRLAKSWGGEDYTKYEGGVYSSEWFWAKILRVAETNYKIASRAATVVEHCEWIPALLTGVSDYRQIKRSRCAMGHKAMWHESWGGYPSAEFLSLLHPRLAEIAATLGHETWMASQPAGALTAEWASRLGLKAGITVAVGAYDAHIGAVGGNVAPGTLLKIMGTSTCDIMVGPKRASGERLVAGICGQVDGSVIPGWIGYEAGQSAFGDIFAWFRSLLAWPLRSVPGLAVAGGADADGASSLKLLPILEAEATKIDPSESGLVALDWLNGRRTPDANQALSGALMGLKLGTDAPAIYRALIEAAAFGSRAIVERLRSEGVDVERVAAVGGVAQKSPLVMQVTADVLNMPISVSSSDQSCALGAAMFAATASGLYPDVLSAQAAMRPPVERIYSPNPDLTAVYDQLYKKYLALGAFAEASTKVKE
jgi:L-ribulokinase